MSARSSSRGVILMVVALACAAVSGARAAEPDMGLAAVAKQTCEALEHAPVRGWGTESTLRPLNDLRHRLRNTERGSAAHQKLLATLPETWDAVQDKFLDALRLTPAATIAFAADGTPTAAPSRPRIAAHVGASTALILRLGARPDRASLTLALDASDIDPAPFPQPGSGTPLPQVAVLPFTARGAPGLWRAALRLTEGQKTWSIPLDIDVGPSGMLTGTVRHEGHNLHAKVFVEGEDGRLFVVPGEPTYRTQSWYAPWRPRFSYVAGAFAMPLPPGTYRVTAMKGYEWRDATRTVRVEAGKTTNCSVEMERLRDLEGQRWLCGDMHLHLRGGPTLRQLRAEDVNVAANTIYSSQRAVPLPFFKKNSDALHLSTGNQEIEHWVFGNVFYFNIPRTVLDPETPQPNVTPMFHYDEQAHRAGGITLRWLRARPFSPKWHGQAQPEIAVSAALGHMDVWTVLENSMQNLLDSPARKWTGRGWGGRLYGNTYETWYALMNCGLRIPAAAGTSYGRLSRLGFNRVYASVDGALTNASWAAALKRGDGFVTNGPLLWLRAGPAGGPCDRLPGDGMDLDRAGDIAVSVKLVSRHPVRRVEILCNGRVVAGRDLADGEPLNWETTVAVRGPCWVAARCFGGHAPRYPHSAAHNQFAHTNPLFVTVGGRRPASSADAKRFVEEIDALIAYVPRLPTEDLQTRALAEYHKAREYFVRQVER